MIAGLVQFLRITGSQLLAHVCEKRAEKRAAEKKENTPQSACKKPPPRT